MKTVSYYDYIKNSDVFTDFRERSIHTSLRVSEKFIAIEGLDGSGTTTQTQLLYDWLKTKHYSTLATKEPTDGIWGSKLRMALQGDVDINPLALAFGFMADRVDHLVSIQHKVDNPKTLVISDRYTLSYLAYQYKDTGKSLEWLLETLRDIHPPDLTIFLDVTPEICLQRMKKSRLSLERYENVVDLESIRLAFHTIMTYLRARGENIWLIDGTQSIEDIQLAIQNLIFPVM
jgi:dTMP kinase